MRKLKDPKFAAKIAQRVDELGELDCVHYAEGDMRIGEMLETWRWKHKQKVSELANEIGINVSSLRRLEAGKQAPEMVSFLKILVWMCSEEENAAANQGTPRSESPVSSDEQGNSMETPVEGGY